MFCMFEVEKVRQWALKWKFYDDGHLGDSYRLESIMASDYLEKPFVVGVGVRGIDR